MIKGVVEEKPDNKEVNLKKEGTKQSRDIEVLCPSSHLGKKINNLVICGT